MDAITSSYCELEDIQGYFKQTVILQNLYKSECVKPDFSRLEFEVNGTPNQWYCIHATGGSWATKLSNKPLIRNILGEAIKGIRSFNGKESDYSFIPIIARLTDLIHPTHQLQSSVLAYPLFGSQLLKRRLQLLAYDLGPGNEDVLTLDNKFAHEIMKQMQKRLEKEMRAYYEFSVPYKTTWTVGLTNSNSVSMLKDLGRPGTEKRDFGLCSNGNLLYMGKEYPYTDTFMDDSTLEQYKILGFIIDLYLGTVQIVCNGTILPAAFGKGAKSFSKEEQDLQQNLIIKRQLIPCFAILYQRNSDPKEACYLNVNFGQKKFYYQVNATALCTIHNHKSTKGVETISILDSANNQKDKISQEEDEKANVSLEKNYFKVSLLPEASKSFSQFPPSVYRRSLAATKIQRQWRKYQGRQFRKRMRKQQYMAASIIQRMARKKLRKIRETKNLAAGKIQKFWRKKLLIWVALLRCVYRHSIKDLHNAASIIQKKWRNWHMFKNSPLAAKYQTKAEGYYF
jgi:hypothetical protein